MWVIVGFSPSTTPNRDHRAKTYRRWNPDAYRRLSRGTDASFPKRPPLESTHAALGWPR
jgi:hypothetical protein